MAKKCDPLPPLDTCGAPYKLTGPQVEPEAAYWTVGPCEMPRVVRIADLLALTDDPDKDNPHYFPPHPCDQKEIEQEIVTLEDLASRRNQTFPAGSTRPAFEKVSEFLQLRPQPIGAVFDVTRPQGTITNVFGQCARPPAGVPEIQTGAELARWFEGETPGLGHRHALNCLILECGFSPARQARIWMALDVAIYSALLAAWHYKWASDRPCTAYRLRPKEFDPSLDVLYDYKVGPAGNEAGRTLRTKPQSPPGTPQTPGTPRHPAYPSGHSTVGGAASGILEYFFPQHKTEIELLGENAGVARLWAGVHYESDHVAGAKLGRTVAALVISQLEGDGVMPVPDKDQNGNPLPPTPDDAPAPDKAKVRFDAYAKRQKCLRPEIPQTCPPLPDDGTGDAASRQSSPQRGAR